jgi:hypothetical protein
MPEELKARCTWPPILIAIITEHNLKKMSAGTNKFKMAAAKSEILTTFITDDIPVKFQSLQPCFLERQVELHIQQDMPFNLIVSSSGLTAAILNSRCLTTSHTLSACAI